MIINRVDIDISKVLPVFILFSIVVNINDKVSKNINIKKHIVFIILECIVHKEVIYYIVILFLFQDSINE